MYIWVDCFNINIMKHLNFLISIVYFDQNRSRVQCLLTYSPAHFYFIIKILQGILKSNTGILFGILSRYKHILEDGKPHIGHPYIIIG